MSQIHKACKADMVVYRVDKVWRQLERQHVEVAQAVHVDPLRGADD